MTVPGDLFAGEHRDGDGAPLRELPPGLWRANELGRHATATVASGYDTLDTQLPGGGWPTSSLTDLLFAQQGAGELRLVLPSLKAITQSGRIAIFLAPPHALTAAALQQYGIDVNKIVVVHSDKPGDRLWAAEQAIKTAGVGALLAWLPQARPEHLRRLQLAAGGYDGLAFLYRPASVQGQPSPAPLRLVCQPLQYGELSVEIIKRRGPACDAPIVLPPHFPALIDRAFSRARNGQITPVDTFHALDRHQPAPAATGPRVPTLAE